MASYLGEVKKSLRERVDKMFDDMWKEVEANLKTSYKNGIQAGKKGKVGKGSGRKHRDDDDR